MSTALPAWISKELRRQRSLLDLVRGGARLLASAMLMAGVGQRGRGSLGRDSVRVWGASPNARLWNLPRRVGLGSAELSASLARFSNELADRMLAQAVPDALDGDAVLSPDEVRTAIAMVLRDLTKRSTSDRLPLRPPGGVTAAAESLQATPAGLLWAAYQAMGVRKEARRVPAEDVAAIAICGLAVEALSRSRRCSLCFRWAWPGQTNCREHTLSNDGRGTRNQRQARYQVARRALSEFKERLGTPPKRLEALSQASVRFLVARVLWGVSAPDEERVAASLAKQVARCKRVAALVDVRATARPAELLLQLQARLDPLELIPGNWQSRIRAAEHWLEAVEESSPGKRRGGKPTRLRILHATMRVKHYAESSGEVAKALGLHPSALSHWLRQRAGDPVVQRLAEAIKANKPLLAERQRHLKRVKAMLRKPSKP